MVTSKALTAALAAVALASNSMSCPVMSTGFEALVDAGACARALCGLPTASDITSDVVVAHRRNGALARRVPGRSTTLWLKGTNGMLRSPWKYLTCVLS